MFKSFSLQRKFSDGSVGKLGVAVQHDDYRWKFYPLVAGRDASRKYHPTFEECLPKWIGYPDRCESVEII